MSGSGKSPGSVEPPYGGAEHCPRLEYQPGKPQRIAVLGIGNDLNGDDAAGVLVARKLIDVMKGQPGDEQRYIVDAGPSPESFTGPLRRFNPHLVVLVDAAELGLAPGSVRWFDWTAAEGLSASTHTLPPSMLARYLTVEMGCQVILAGIQPAHLNFDEPVSGEALRAVQNVSLELVALLESQRPIR